MQIFDSRHRRQEAGNDLARPRDGHRVRIVIVSATGGAQRIVRIVHDCVEQIAASPEFYRIGHLIASSRRTFAVSSPLDEFCDASAAFSKGPLSVRLLVCFCLSMASAISCFAGDDVRLATTTSTENSGLLKVIVPLFESRYGGKVRVIAVGTGAALKLGENGDA